MGVMTSIVPIVMTCFGTIYRFSITYSELKMKYLDKAYIKFNLTCTHRHKIYQWNNIKVIWLLLSRCMIKFIEMISDC